MAKLKDEKIEGEQAERADLRRSLQTADAKDREVEARLVEILAAAGIPEGRIRLEVLMHLPPEFARAYRRLHERALPETVRGGSGRLSEERALVKKVPGSARGKRQYVASGETHAQSARVWRGQWVVGDEDALELKGSIDRKLKRIARELEEALEKPAKAAGRASAGRKREEAKSLLACSGCDRLLDGIVRAAMESPTREPPNACPWCGAKFAKTRPYRARS